MIVLPAATGSGVSVADTARTGAEVTVVVNVASAEVARFPAPSRDFTR